MDYEKKYKAVIEKVKQLLEANPSDEGLKNWVEDTLPELNESEDERIKKALIALLKFGLEDDSAVAPGHNVTKEDALDWLEKQGERKPVDKPEPKFKVGDWVVDKTYAGGSCIGEVGQIEDAYYTMKKTDGDYVQGCMPISEHYLRKWTIEDAEDGDVLCYKCEISLYARGLDSIVKGITTFGGFTYHCCYDGKRFITRSFYSLTAADAEDIRPATKEERDLLFQKMEKAGYEWDAEKKELIKIKK